MREIRTEDAVGHILCHDITQIIKGQKKGVLFKKGHIVREEDISMSGKNARAFFTKMKQQKFFTDFPQMNICMAAISKKVRSS